MRCLDALGANLVIQDEANPGRWTGADGNGIEQWQPLSWMGSTYRAVSDPSVHFDYNVTAMMVGNLADLPFDGQSAITQRGLGGRGCHYVGNGAFVPGEDQTGVPALRRPRAGVPGARTVGGADAPARRAATDRRGARARLAKRRSRTTTSRRRSSPISRFPVDGRRPRLRRGPLTLRRSAAPRPRPRPPGARTSGTTSGPPSRVPHTECRGAAAPSALRAPQPASSRSAPASSWPAALSS